MPNRKNQSKQRHTNKVIEAHGGVISEFDNIAEEIRVRTGLTAQIIGAVKPRLGSIARISDDIAITCILSDLRHYCDCRSFAFKKLDKAAHALYLEEKTYEDAWQPYLDVWKAKCSDSLSTGGREA